MTASMIYAQPAIRDGWPQDFGPVGQMASLIEPNPLAVGVTSDGTRIIASGTNFQVRILNIDGTLLQDIDLSGAVPEPAGAIYLGGGPLIGDVDGDGEVEVVACLRAANGRTKSVAVIELDGTINSTLSQGWALSNVDISSLVLANMDTDLALEIVVYADDQLHVIDNDGSDMAGFPWTISRGHAGGGPAVLPGQFNNGTPIIFWASNDGNIHAREVGATTEITGFPNTFGGSVGIAMPAPVVIPTDTGWMVGLVTNSQLYLWNQGGNAVTGFPFTPTAVDQSILSLQAADLNGDSNAELIFRYYNSDLVHAVSTSGQYITGFPVATGTGAGRSESVAAVKMSENEEAMFFTGSLGPGTNDSHLYGFQGSSPLAGFPIDYTTNENIPVMSTAVFPPVDGIMSIVQGSWYGYITVYDLPVTATETGTLEWAAPYGNGGGNRCYNPLSLSSEPTAPYFVFSPGTVEFDTLHLGNEASVTMTITNLGLDGEVTSLTLDPVEDSITHDGVFPVTLAEGASYEFTVTWFPDVEEDLGDLDVDMIFAHDGQNDGESTIDVTGYCGVWPILEFNPSDSLQFGIVWDDNSTATLQLSIENSGGVEGIIESMDVEIFYASQFEFDAEFPLSIEPGAEVIVNVTWTPVRMGDLETFVEIVHNDYRNGGELVLDIIGSYQSGVAEAAIPNEYYLAQNYPNPFNPETAITFGVKEPGFVTLKVYNMNGQEVVSLVNGFRDAGSYQTSFNGVEMASGVYIYTLKVNGFTSTKKMVLLQ